MQSELEEQMETVTSNPGPVIIYIQIVNITQQPNIWSLIAVRRTGVAITEAAPKRARMRVCLENIFAVCFAFERESKSC